MVEQVIAVTTIVLTILLGLCVGSFLNVVIYRLPNDMSLVRPASHCPKCGNPIKWYDNIPLVSYIVLRGKCRHCKEPISFRYPMVELLNAILWFLCLLCFTNFIIAGNEMNWLRFIVSCIVCSTLLCVFFCDLDNMEIPEVFMLILLLCGIVLLLDHPSQENIMLKVFGFLGAGLLFYLVNLVFKLIRKRDGIGFGDIELIACAGLILGGYNTIFALVVSCVCGGIALVVLTIVRKHDKDEEYPFAVILTSGIALAMFVGPYVVNWYLGLMGA
ncbi:MAG: prepilin peptidase [Bacilli bacterium]|nr:prepilin peptidase [Bacilli bacterium]